MLMMYEWDENKRKVNLQKHKIDFVDAVKIFDSFYLEFSSPKKEEERFLVIGVLENILCSLVYTNRGNKKRIISVRRARKKERVVYERERKN